MKRFVIAVAVVVLLLIGLALMVKGVQIGPFVYRVF